MPFFDTFARFARKLCDRQRSTSSECLVVKGNSNQPRSTSPRPAIPNPNPPTSTPEHLRDATDSDTPSTTVAPWPDPVDLLPPELSAHVFALLCRAEHGNKRQPRITPLFLGSVCQKWRRLVWSTPYLWSSIPLSVVKDRCDVQVELLREWLARSGTCPLTIQLSFEKEGDWSDDIPHHLIDALMSSADRWLNIDIILPESWYPLMEDIKNSLPMVRKVETQPLWTDCSLSPSRRQKLSLFSNAPRLEDLHLNGYYLTDVDVCWSHLKRVTLQHVYLDECFYALALAPNLTYCRIFTILSNDIGRRVQESDLPMPFLEQLSVISASWEDLARLLHMMTLPQLKTFSLISPDTTVDLGACARLLVAAQANQNLRRIKLHEFSIGQFDQGAQEDLICFLQAFNDLEEIEVNLTDDSEAHANWTFFSTLLGGSWCLEDPTEATCQEEQGASDDEEESMKFPNLRRFIFSGPLGPAHLPSSPENDEGKLQAWSDRAERRFGDILERRCAYNGVPELGSDSPLSTPMRNRLTTFHVRPAHNTADIPWYITPYISNLSRKLRTENLDIVVPPL